MIRIRSVNCNFEREQLAAPFGFKGGYITEAWQTVALLTSESGREGLGLGTQSVLWSDARVFSGASEAGGNSMMFAMTEHALRAAQGLEFDTPPDLLDQVLPATHGYGRRITGRRNLRLTFALNALVPVDLAAWMLYAGENGMEDFDAMIPEAFRPVLRARHARLAQIPLYSYGTTLDEISRAVDEGFFFAKIKIGADPDKDGDGEKMLEWDKRRLASIHERLKDREVEWTENGRIPYYLDANGRYDGKARLERLLEFADGIGALERIALIEEPFPEEYEEDVSDLPVRLAADESVHDDRDALKRIDMGYKAITLKPIAKTLSMTLRIARVAREREVPCFCADLTVNPILVDWNKAVAARLDPLPTLKIGVVESNGAQNYRDWERMKSYHPCAGAAWIDPVRGILKLDEDFYKRSGGILLPSPHYRDLV